MGVNPELISLFRSEFELCKVAHGETLAVLTHEQSRADYAEASLIAADALDRAHERIGRDSFAGASAWRSLDGGRDRANVVKYDNIRRS